MLLGPGGIAAGLSRVMDAAGAASGADRARLAVLRRGRVAAIERFRQGRHYWVLPGGGVERGETIAAAALREAAEELGLAVRLGALRAVVHSQLDDGRVIRNWCFDASADSDHIAITGGPEAGEVPGRGSYAAVWLDLRSLVGRSIYPAGFASLIAASAADGTAVRSGGWPDDVVEIID